MQRDAIAESLHKFFLLPLDFLVYEEKYTYTLRLLLTEFHGVV